MYITKPIPSTQGTPWCPPFNHICHQVVPKQSRKHINPSSIVHHQSFHHSSINHFHRLGKKSHHAHGLLQANKSLHSPMGETFLNNKKNKRKGFDNLQGTQQVKHRQTKQHTECIVHCCRNSPLSPPRCLARGSDPLGASSPWDLAPESLSPTGQGQGNAVGTRDECHGPADARSPAQCAWKQCGNLKYRLNPCPPAFPQHWFQELWFFAQKKIDKELFANFFVCDKSDPHPSGRSAGAGATAGKQVRFLMLCCSLTAAFCSFALLGSSPATLSCRMQHTTTFAVCFCRYKVHLRCGRALPQRSTYCQQSPLLKSSSATGIAENSSKLRWSSTAVCVRCGSTARADRGQMWWSSATSAR
jgi:hypothetical protein